MTYRLESTLQLMLRDLQLSPVDVLRQARMPIDLFQRPVALVTAREFFALWDALEAVSSNPRIGFVVGQSVSAEMFSPPLFAGLCSPDGHTAIERLARYKALVGPLQLDVEREDHSTQLTFRFPTRVAPPHQMGVMECTFWTHFLRMTTRSQVVPREVVMVDPRGELADYEAFFGVPVRRGAHFAVRFSELDLRRPFLTANAGLWEFFEPQLRRRLSELDGRASAVERVRSVLVELLPSGRGSIGEVAREMGVGARTLQRRLARDDTNYRAVLDQLREELARHYLRTSEMTGAEISFLLGYDDPNSFYRAFNQWTATTPESARRAARAAG